MYCSSLGCYIFSLFLAPGLQHNEKKQHPIFLNPIRINTKIVY